MRSETQSQLGRRLIITRGFAYLLTMLVGSKGQMKRVGEMVERSGWGIRSKLELASPSFGPSQRRPHPRQTQ